MKKRTNGKKGEERCIHLVCAGWDAQLLKRNNDEKYDFKVATSDGNEHTFEVKTNPQAITKYGGFSVEIAHKQNSYITSYITKEPFMYEGVKVVSTGLMASKADWYIFHDDKKQYYFISKTELMKWAKDVWKNHHHRVVWGGYESHTLQIQIKLHELKQLGHYIDLRQKRGRKSVDTQG